MHAIKCSCPCGEASFKLHSQPKVRFFCHCDICQKVYQQPYSDFVVLPGDSVTLPEKGIQFHKLRPPPNLGRGLCESCQSPVAGIFSMVPGLKFAFVPVANIQEELDIPDTMGHLFYQSRTESVNDDKPKYNSYMSSQWAISKAVFQHVLLASRRSK